MFWKRRLIRKVDERWQSRIEGFDEKILACAKEEFLEKGYTDASIRTIAQNAGVSTSTIYTRYSDKEGLFRFLVEPVAKGLKELLRQSLSDFSSLTGHEQNENLWNTQIVVLKLWLHISMNIFLNLSCWLPERRETTIRNFRRAGTTGYGLYKEILDSSGK